MVKIGMYTVDLSSALRPSDPIREPIEAVVLYVRDGECSSLWCELDFMDFNRRVTDTLGEAVSRATGTPRDRVHILTTHNHGGGTPDLDTLADLLASGAERAVNGARAARMRVAFTKAEVILVFDAYLVKDGIGSDFTHDGYRVVYTKQDETADAFIERMMFELGPDYSIKVVTGDKLVQFSAVSSGILRMTAKEFEDDVRRVGNEITAFVQKLAESK